MQPSFAQKGTVETMLAPFVTGKEDDWPRSTMDSIRVSEAPDPGSIPGEATV